VGSSQKVTVGLIQTSCSPDRDVNLSRAIDGIREAAGQGAGIICLQELFRSLYFCQEENADWFDTAESIPGPTTEALAAVARECGAVVIASIFEKRAPGL
jgi:N-carbamoylputrescine amidase